MKCAWWATAIECVSAVARLELEDALTGDSDERCPQRVDRLAEAWNEVQPTAALRGTARRLFRVHPFHAADALQLAAAVIAAEGVPPTLEIVTLDDRLGGVARREGFTVRGDLVRDN